MKLMTVHARTSAGPGESYFAFWLLFYNVIKINDIFSTHLQKCWDFSGISTKNDRNQTSATLLLLLH